MNMQDAERAADLIVQEERLSRAGKPGRSHRFRARFDRMHTAVVALVSFGISWRLLQMVLVEEFLVAAFSVLVALALAVWFPPMRRP